MSLKLNSCCLLLLGSWLCSTSLSAATLLENDVESGRLTLSISKAERKKLLKVPKINLLMPGTTEDGITCFVTKLGSTKVTLESDTEDFSPLKEGLRFEINDAKTFVAVLEKHEKPPEIPEFKPRTQDPAAPILNSTAPFAVPGMPPQSEFLLLRPIWRDDVVQPRHIAFTFDLFQNDLKTQEDVSSKATYDGTLTAIHMSSPLRSYRNSALGLSLQRGESKEQRQGGTIHRTKRSQLDFSYERGFMNTFSLLLGASMVAYEIPDALGGTTRQGIIPFATFNFWFENTRFGFSYVPNPPSRIKEADSSERNRYRLFVTHGGTKLHFFAFYDLRFADEQSPIKREDQLLQVGIGTQDKTMQYTLVAYMAQLEAKQNQVTVTSSDATAVRFDLSWLGSSFFSGTFGLGAQHLAYRERATTEPKKYEGYGLLARMSVQQGF